MKFESAFERPIAFFLKFMKDFEVYSSECDSIIKKANDDISNRQKKSAQRVSGEKNRMNQEISTLSTRRRSILTEYEQGLTAIENSETLRRSTITNTISDNKETAIKNPETKGAMDSEISRLESSFYENQAEIDRRRMDAWTKCSTKLSEVENNTRNKQASANASVYSVIETVANEDSPYFQAIQTDMKEKLKKRTEAFHRLYPPETIEKEYYSIYHSEPVVDDYTCVTDNPTSVRVSDLVYSLIDLKLCDYAKGTLFSDYYFLTKYVNEPIRSAVLKTPYIVTFDDSFNFLFEVNNNNRQTLIDRACSLAMRLFMMLPPNKVNFTFFDPIMLGETFALFTRLVDVNDTTSKVINGKIWSNASDIEEKLRITTDHIANVTQRCLQGQYDSIQAYNAVAGQNAEPYQVLMIMDFPAAFNENSLRLLEQIISTGPKCGVYTVILKSAEQYSKADEKRIKPLIDNLVRNMNQFNAQGSNVAFEKVEHNGRKVTFDIPKLLSNEELDKVIPVLKSGIKNAERIVVGFDSIIPPKAEWFKGDCSEELAIPIGVHGANNIQNLRFGVGGAHHALVAGQIGSGKSSLLHTIIMSSLINYAANQLQIFLVDFKRGVEFKIYANYSLENFKVIAVESEREFGCSVLEFLDKEQGRRADKFKRINVDNVEDYRKKTGEVLPRVLLIIDEFHVLFSKDTSDINSKKSSAYLEQIIRQGRAFGIHVILASQTMSNIGGINHGVWGQIGVRIALKCPKSDAKFVLGSDNDAVDLLSADNPGQAVYNSDGGNIVANTVFRVAYLEQDEQDEYLSYISANEPRFDYPETRVMLSNVEDNIYNKLQKFANGQKVEFTGNSLIIGEPLKLVNNMKMNFKRKQGSNLIVIGNDEAKARTLFMFAALSASLHKLHSNGYKKPTQPCIYLFDYAPQEDYYEKDILIELSKRLPSFIKYIPFDETDEYMEELYQQFVLREKGQSAIEDTYMFVYGLQRARNLRSSDIYKKNSSFDDFDEFGSSTVNQQLSVKPYEMFLNIVQRGPAVGINSVIWEDNFKVFMNNYADMLPNFDMRIAFTMPDEDSINFIEEVDGSKIGENGAVYNYNGNQKFRPYRKPDIKWIERITQRMESN